MGDMEPVDIYGVFMGQKGSCVFIVPSFYEGSLQIERPDRSKIIESHFQKDQKHI